MPYEVVDREVRQDDLNLFQEASVLDAVEGRAASAGHDGRRRLLGRCRYRRRRRLRYKWVIPREAREAFQDIRPLTAEDEEQRRKCAECQCRGCDEQGEQPGEVVAQYEARGRRLRGGVDHVVRGAWDDLPFAVVIGVCQHHARDGGGRDVREPVGIQQLAEADADAGGLLHPNVNVARA